jgi:hypothetical protein
MTRNAITRERIDELLRFLAPFERPGRSFIKAWSTGREISGGARTFPYPVYEEDVLAFIRLAGQSWWSDYKYDPAAASEMLGDDEFIQGCTLEDVRTMLTCCVRLERFCDGYWGHVLETGRVTTLLRRLTALRETLPGDSASMGGGELRPLPETE